MTQQSQSKGPYTAIARVVQSMGYRYLVPVEGGGSFDNVINKVIDGFDLKAGDFVSVTIQPAPRPSVVELPPRGGTASEP